LHTGHSILLKQSGFNPRHFRQTRDGWLLDSQRSCKYSATARPSRAFPSPAKHLLQLVRAASSRHDSSPAESWDPGVAVGPS